MKRLLYIFILLFSAYAFAADNIRDGVPITGGFTPGSDGEYGLDVSINSSVSGAPELGAGLRPGAGGVWYYYDTGTSTWTQIGTGSMTYPGAGIPLSTGTAWGTSYTLDTDMTSVSASDDTIPSAKAIKTYVDAQIDAALTESGLPEISITTPAEDGSWVNSTTYTALAGTAISSAGLATIEWKLNAGEYAAVTDDGLLGSGSEAWTVPTMTLTENTLNTIYIQATSDTALARTKTRTIYADATAPVVDLTAVHDPANPSTHDGTGTDTFVLDWAELVTETNPASARYQWTVGETAGDWTAWASPYADVSATLPSGESTMTLGVEVTDLAGNTGSDTVAITYGAGTTYLASYDFEEAGTPEGITVSSGTPNFDQATGPLVGTESCQLTGCASAATQLFSFSYAANGSVYTYGRIKISASNTTSSRYIAAIRQGTNVLASFESDYDGGRTFRVLAFGGTAAVAGAFANDTEYEFWFEYTKGTGADAVARLYYVAADTTGKPAEPSASSTNGTRTTNADNMYFVGGYSAGNNCLDYRLDKVRVDDVVIGSGPS